MSPQKRTLAALSGLLLTLLCVLGGSPAALASDGGQGPATTDGGVSPQVVYNPRVYTPSGGLVSPTATTLPRGQQTPDALPRCPSGYACLHTIKELNSSIQKWYTWKLFNYGTYSLQGFAWSGTSWIQNAQTDGAAVVTFDGGSIPEILGCYNPAGGSQYYPINYNPVWYVQLNRASC
ncbi:hypothetical protein ACFT2C_03610 [Promicromonospora sp. NPDC057138]|uniref:hypothetical protein n=1 Tax=Promicromonospora sp. NPDC057138 TaxID=3346031 RepID=UPI00362DBF0B